MNTLKIIWHRLPRIAIYILAIYVLLFVGQKAFYRFMPASYFLEYTSVNVPNNQPIYAHSPVPVTFCREKKGNYPITGYRVYYKLDKTMDRSKGKQVQNQPVNNQITQNRCVDLLITPAQYDHEAGTYFFRTFLTFRVDGNVKQVINESNTYVIQDKPMTTDDMLKRIQELQDEINRLKSTLEQALAKTPQTVAVVSRSTSTTVAKQSPVATTSQPEQTPPEIPTPQQISQGSIVRGVLDDVLEAPLINQLGL